MKQKLQNRCVLTIIRCAKIQSFSRRLLNPSIFWGVPNPGICLLCLFSGKFTSPNTGIKTQPRYPSDAKNDTIIISTSLLLLLTTTNIADLKCNFSIPAQSNLKSGPSRSRFTLEYYVDLSSFPIRVSIRLVGADAAVNIYQDRNPQAHHLDPTCSQLQELPPNIFSLFKL